MWHRDADERAERTCPLPGDDLVPDARFQTTRGITIAATPETIWPMLMDMVVREAPPAPALRRAMHEGRALVLGALYDHTARRYVVFDADRPAQFWQASWALVLEPLDTRRTRLRVRSRVAFTAEAVKRTSTCMHPFNDFMDRVELRRLRARAEGRRASVFARGAEWLRNLGRVVDR